MEGALRRLATARQKLASAQVSLSFALSVFGHVFLFYHSPLPLNCSLSREFSVAFLRLSVSLWLGRQVLVHACVLVSMRRRITSGHIPTSSRPPPRLRLVHPCASWQRLSLVAVWQRDLEVAEGQVEALQLQITAGEADKALMVEEAETPWDAPTKRKIEAAALLVAQLIEVLTSRFDERILCRGVGT